MLSDHYSYTYSHNRQDNMPSVGATPSLNAGSNSPSHMKTPYLDSSLIDTPFMDVYTADTPPFVPVGLDFSPYLIYNAFSNMHMMNNNNNKDVCVSGYLNNNSAGYNDMAAAELGMAHDPVAQFNGDPSLLLIDKSKHPLNTPAAATITTPIDTSITNTPSSKAGKPSPAVKLENLTEQEIDSLFPPLASSQEQFETAADPDMANEQEINPSHASSVAASTTPLLKLEELLGLDDSSSPLSEQLDTLDAVDEQLDDEESSIIKGEEAQPATNDSSTNSKATKRSYSDAASDNDSQQENQPVKKARTSNFTEANKRIPSAVKDNTKDRKNKKAAKNSSKEPKLYECPICGLVSKRRYNLNTHIKTHDKGRVREFPCTQCHKAFDRRHDRDRHLATVHRHERSFGCKHCKSHFSRRDALNRHLIQRHDYSESDLAD